MRLNELVGNKDRAETKAFKSHLQPLSNEKNWLGNMQAPTSGRRKDALKAFLKFAKDKGFQPLGHGVFGAVLTHPNINYAIKIIKNDPAYMKYVSYAQSHRVSCVPKFRGKVMKLDEDCFVVRMELLSPLPDDSPEIDAQLTIFQYAALHNFKDIAEFISIVEKRASSFVRSNVDHEHSYRFNYQNILDAAKSLHSDPAMIKTIFDLKALKDGMHFDLRFPNFMQRGDQIVLTDPFFTSDSVR